MGPVELVISNGDDVVSTMSLDFKLGCESPISKTDLMFVDLANQGRY